MIKYYGNVLQAYVSKKKKKKRLNLKNFIVLGSYLAHACIVLTHEALPFIWQCNFFHFILCLYLVYMREALLRMYLAGDIFVVVLLYIK